jgi:signal transduction histidine kinase
MTEEVFQNYLSNAIHYCSGEKKIKISVEHKEDTVRISVFNTGASIPEESLPLLWDKFYKVDKARTREYGGSGVGLSIVKAMMESMNQGYGVLNEADGVTFWFELECADRKSEG